MMNAKPTQVFDVAWGLVDAQLHKVEVANRRAARAGLPGYTAEVVGTYRVALPREHADEPKRYRIRAIVEVYGEVPKVDGWEFAATVQWDSVVGAIVNRVPGLDEVALPRPVERECEHCNSRRHRKDTFLVVSDDGDVKQVGRNCLTAFTGIPVGWVSEYTRGVDEVDEAGYAGQHDTRYDIMDVLTAAAVFTRLHGWVPKSAYEGTPTVGLVWYILEPGTTKYAQKVKAEYRDNVTDADRDAAAAAYEWAHDLPDTDHGDYLTALRTVCQAEDVSARNVALLTSAIQAHAKAQEQDLIRRKEQAEAKPVPLGKGVEVEGEVVRLKWQESYTYHGSPTLKARVQGDGWAVWTSVPAAFEEDVEVGHKVRFVANVEPSDDTSFGFAKRPRKWEVVGVG